MITDQFVTYEVAKLAKEKGFDGECRDFYCNDKLQKRISVTSCNRQVTSFDYCSNAMLEDYDSPKEYCHYAAPTQSLLQRWLREEKGIIVEVFMDDDSNMPLTYNIHQYKDFNWECVCHHHGNYYAVTDWELCLEDALKYALERLI